MKALEDIARALDASRSLPRELRRRLPFELEPDWTSRIITSPSAPDREVAQPRGLVETVTLGEAGALISALGAQRTVLLLGPPGVGKSELVQQVAAAKGLPFRALMAPQLMPEDVLGMPHLVGERVRFAPPAALLPDDGAPVVILVDELGSAPQEVQRALHQLLLDRAIGEHRLPEGSIVVAASNRVDDGAFARAMSAALMNRVLCLNVDPSHEEWVEHARRVGVRHEIVAYLRLHPCALRRDPPSSTEPYSTPRSWVALSRDLDRLEADAHQRSPLRRAVTFGLLSPSDAADFLACVDDGLDGARELVDYVAGDVPMPRAGALRWRLICSVREELASLSERGVSAKRVNAFLRGLSAEERMVLVEGNAERWVQLGAAPALREMLEEALP